ncbi:hypothetical protein EAS64_10495 [Trebonia kvetii]|uniref:Inositol monophosphatase n=1 Tax=Trebonia kvetii TaxID=2480626 RepID=A0A6P2C4C8_9ACTN|nr:hypothetical protein [Trebonia kvetii]TVZ05041.1 hypothetical protein EAS64_10495 [Trebonia kvetii]
MTGPAAPEGVPPWLRSLLRTMHENIRSAVREDLGAKEKSFLAGEARSGAGDVSFQIDVRPEEIVEQAFDTVPEAVMVVCEGLGQRVFPARAAKSEAAWWVIIDPLDGSREIAYGKRSAWVLSGIAPAGPAPTLADIVWAIQTEVPVLSQQNGVVITAGRERAAVLESCDLTTGVTARTAQGLHPSAATTVRGGYAVFTDYFAGSHALTARVADLVFDYALGPVKPGEALAFNDQYLSTAGCLYLIASGTYRFCADLRPVIGQLAARSGRNVGLCAHPYDLCTYLIAQQAGALITDPAGAPLSYPLATDVDCGWVGYANQDIKNEMETPLHAVLAAGGCPGRGER